MTQQNLILTRRSGRPRFTILAALLLLILSPNLARAGAPPGQLYTLQADDSLSGLADKFFNDLEAWPAILVATNAKAEEDSRLVKIYNPDRVEVGQPLWIPEPDQVETLLAQYIPDQPRLQSLTPELLAGFENYIETKRVRYKIPGAVVILVRGNEVIFAKGFGVQELGRPDPVTPETVFAIGSTTKAMTSMMIASMVDEGLLGWDQPVTELWPDFALSDPAQTPQIRMRDMLNMGSGLPRRDLGWSGAELSAEQLMASLVEFPVWGAPGQYYYYNNQMVSTGGYVAALAAGGEYGQLREAYSDQLHQRVFAPIGMQSATTSVEAALANPDHATPHDLNLYDEILPTHYHVDLSITPAGGVYANALDLARFLITEMNGGLTREGVRVVSAESLSETHQRQTEITDKFYYGLGWFIEDNRNVELIWHDGDVFGFKALISMIPEADLGLVVLSNRMLSTAFVYGLQYRLVELMFDLQAQSEEVFDDIWDGFEERVIEIRAGLSPTVDPNEVSKFVGQYTGNWRIELRDGNKLFAVRGPYAWHLLAGGDDGAFIVNNGYGIGIAFFLKEDEATGKITMSFTSAGEPAEYELLAGSQP